jgi:hypothetical protein
MLRKVSCHFTLCSVVKTLFVGKIVDMLHGYEGSFLPFVKCNTDIFVMFVLLPVSNGIYENVCCVHTEFMSLLEDYMACIVCVRMHMHECVLVHACRLECITG